MPRRGRHRTRLPLRLVAAVAALLVGGTAVVLGGTALAHESGGGHGSDGGGLLSSLSSITGGSDSGDGSGSKDGKGSKDGQDSGSEDSDASKDGQDSGSKDSDGSKQDEGSKDSDGSKQDGGSKDSDGSKQDEGSKDDDGSKDAKDSDAKDSGAKVEFPGRDKASPPDDADFVPITDVAAGSGGGRGGDFAGGSFRTACGVADGTHQNSDNLVLAPGKRNAAQHVHDYVGNTATTFSSSDEDLRDAGTTCDDGDLSTYYWPILRDLDGTGPDVGSDGGSLDGNVGSVLHATSVDLTYHGNPKGDVVAAPEGLRYATGDAKAHTGGTENANAKWTCTGFEDRTTTKYPLCPSGSKLVRILDFPSCWDGKNTDSDDHRSHLVFPGSDGSCESGFEPVPALRMTLTYDRPDGKRFAVDSFPDQQHDPKTDHASAINFMPDALMTRAVSCINDGRNC